MRAALDVDNGASGHNVKFYVAHDVDGLVWEQIDSQDSGTTTSVFSSTSNVRIGEMDAANRLTGTVYAAVAGALVASPNFRTQPDTPSSTTLTDSNGLTWTVGAAASLASLATVPFSDITTATSINAALSRDR